MTLAQHRVYTLLRRLLFLLPPERAHTLVFATLRAVTAGAPVRSRLRRVLGPADPVLASTVFGVRFPGPLGLAAGFDKDGTGLATWGALGFGYAEIGTVTDDVAKAVGARGITCEPPVSETRRLGQFADKHQLMIGYHGHSNVSSPESFGRPGAWEQAFFYSKYNGANIDIGHFAAGNSVPATEFIKRYADRITNLHLKDRKFNEGENQPWGQGDSQVREILQLMKREKYPFMATIELEYRIPEDSDTMTELAKCVQFCRDALA